MSRSGFDNHDGDEGNWGYICWRGAYLSALRGRRGQAFLRELIAALDAIPDKRLIKEDLIQPDSMSVCAMGAVGLARGFTTEKMRSIDPEDYDAVSHMFGVNEKIVREVEYANDEACEFQRHGMRPRPRAAGNTCAPGSCSVSPIPVSANTNHGDADEDFHRGRSELHVVPIFPRALPRFEW